MKLNNKIRWPKFLTFRRTLLLGLVLIFGLVLSIYFLGGYKSVIKSNGYGYSSQPFDPTGFTGYNELYQENKQIYLTQKAELDQIAKDLDIETSSYQQWVDFTLAVGRNGVILKTDLNKIRFNYAKLDDLALTVPEDDRIDFASIIDSAKVVENEREYVDALFDKYQLVLSNDNFNFYFNYRYTNFKIVLKDSYGNETDNVWSSNPERDTIINQTYQRSVRLQQLSQFRYTFATEMSSSTVNNYEYSIMGISNDGLTSSSASYVLDPLYYFKTVKTTNGDGVEVEALQVYYHLAKHRGEILYSDFPYQISKARWEELIERNVQLAQAGEAELLTAFEKNNINSYYQLLSNEKSETGEVLDPFYRYTTSFDLFQTNITTTVLNKLYDIFYNKCGYTAEDLEFDLADQGLNYDTVSFDFKVALQYSLSSSGLEAKVLNDSIDEGHVDEKGNYLNPLISIELLPYFASVTTEYQDGDNKYPYTGNFLIPDGSGAVQHINSTKDQYTQISRKVYSTDLLFTSDVQTMSTYDVMLPMAALIQDPIYDMFSGNLIKEGKGIMMYSQLGEAQMLFNSNIRNSLNIFNRMYFTLVYREYGEVVIGVGYSRQTFNKTTEIRVESDMAVNYQILDQDQLTPGGVAQAYRQHIIDHYDLEIKDNTDNPVLNVNILGSYDFKDNFLGVNFENYGSMTTFKQILEITEELGRQGAKEINLFVHGWRSYGLKNYSFDNFKISKEMGGSKELKNLIDNLQQQDQINVTLSPYLNFGLINEFQETFGATHYSARNLTGDALVIYDYNLAVKVFDKSTDGKYILSPHYFVPFMEKLVENFKAKVKTNAIVLDMFSNNLTADYKRRNELLRFTAKIQQEESLKILSQNIDDVTLYSPYEYALPYVNNILEVPYSSTSYEAYDYSVPLYQLVLNGIIDYSGMIINANDEKGMNWHLMNILETGSNLAFSFSYENSNKLSLTNYNQYFYTEYISWLNHVNQMLAIVNQIGIHQAVLVEHTQIANFVYKVCYQLKSSYFAGESYQTAYDNDQVIEIYLNYSTGVVNIGDQQVLENQYLVTKTIGGK